MAEDRPPSAALRWVGVIVIGVAGTGAALLALNALLGAAAPGLADALRAAPLATGLVAALPLVAAVAAALTAARAPGGAAASARAAAPVEHPSRVAVSAHDAANDRREAEREGALRLLSALQQQGRFLDFLEEDLDPYPDDQVGGAVRAIHAGCRTVLRERLELVPVIASSEGSTVTVDRGFDASAVRVVGNVRGEPPYQGVLRHPGWRSTAITLPERTGAPDSTILAPAEVEVP